jgi:uncharacterized membrane protein
MENMWKEVVMIKLEAILCHEIPSSNVAGHCFRTLSYKTSQSETQHYWCEVWYCLIETW